MNAIAPTEADTSPEAVRAEVYDLTKRGTDAAKEVAAEEPLNYHKAELLLRNVAAIFNAPDAGPTARLEELSETEVDNLQGLATRGFDFLGDDVKQKTRAELESGVQPTSELEAKAILMGRGFNLMQVAVSMGPNPEQGGYDPAKEDELRTLLVDSAEVFGTTYQKLAEKGVPIAADADRRKYFESNINAVKPKQQTGDPPEAADVGDWI